MRAVTVTVGASVRSALRLRHLRRKDAVGRGRRIEPRREREPLRGGVGVSGEEPQRAVPAHQLGEGAHPRLRRELAGDERLGVRGDARDRLREAHLCVERAHVGDLGLGSRIARGRRREALGGRAPREQGAADRIGGGVVSVGRDEDGGARRRLGGTRRRRMNDAGDERRRGEKASHGASIPCAIGRAAALGRRLQRIRRAWTALHGRGLRPRRRPRNSARFHVYAIGPRRAEDAQEERMRWNLAIIVAAAAAACSNATSSSSGAASWSGGAMELRLVDAPADQVKEIVVTIRKVTAHSSTGGWVELSSQKATVDLLKLQNGTFASLGVTALPGGRLTQIRLLVDEAGPNYVTTPDDVHHPLEVPSGTQSGIKLKLGVDLPDCPVGTLTLDFDGKKSIFTHPTGNGDLWILRPVVRLKAVTAQPGDCSTGAPPAPPATDPPSPPSTAPIRRRRTRRRRRRRLRLRRRSSRRSPSLRRCRRASQSTAAA
jgi:hypothetical protein